MLCREHPSAGAPNPTSHFNAIALSLVTSGGVVLLPSLGPCNPRFFFLESTTTACLLGNQRDRSIHPLPAPIARRERANPLPSPCRCLELATACDAISSQASGLVETSLFIFSSLQLIWLSLPRNRTTLSTVAAGGRSLYASAIAQLECLCLHETSEFCGAEVRSRRGVRRWTLGSPAPLSSRDNHAGPKRV